MGALSEYVGRLNDAIELRNNLIVQFKSKGATTPEEILQFYFGERDASRNLDRVFPDSIKAIIQHTDNAIFFGVLAAKDLVNHAKALKIKFGKNAPKIHGPDFSTPELEGLIPDDENYAAWLRGFPQDSQN